MGLLRPRLERQFHFAPRARGFVGGENNFEDRAAIRAGDQRLFVVLDAIDEVLHLLREAVVPFLLVNGERPALGRAGFLDGVIVAFGAVGLNGVAVVEIGVGHPFRAVDFGPVVHAAHFRPAFLRQRDHAVRELKDDE